MRAATFFLALSGVLSGCMTAGPDYQAPSLVGLTAERWSANWEPAVSHIEASEWSQLNDPLLAELQQMALNNSPTLQSAEARLKQARAGVKAADVASLPITSGSGSVRRQDQEQSTASTSSLGFDASWELDLFGGQARSQQAADARSLAAQLSLAHVGVSLKTEVAIAYFTHLFNLSSTVTAEHELVSRRTTAELVQVRFSAGAASLQDLDKVRAAVAEASSTLASVHARSQQSLNQLALLTAVPVQALPTALKQARAFPAVLQLPHLKLPAEVVSRRPDVAAAEKQLAAASAEIGVTEAQFLPSVRLLGSVGVNTAGKGQTESWGFGPSLTVPVLSATQREASRARALANYDEALANWKSTVLQAVKEVEDNLVRVAAAEQRKAAAEETLAFQQKILLLAQARFDAGALSLLEREDAVRAVLQAQNALLSLQLEYVSANLALRKALAVSA